MTRDEEIADEVRRTMAGLVVCGLCKNEFRKPDEEADEDTLSIDEKPWCGCLPF